MVPCTIQILFIYIFFSYVAVNIFFFFFFTCVLSFHQSPFSIIFLHSLSLPVSKHKASWVVMEVSQKSIQSKRLPETGVVLAWPREHVIVKQEPPYRDIYDSGVDEGTREGGLCGFILAITISNNQVFMGVLKIRRKQRDLGFQVWWDSSGSLETSCQVRVFSSRDDFRS